jgi:hypothetical protein
MEHGHGQLDVAKVPGAGLHVLLARATDEAAIDAAEPAIVEARDTSRHLVLVHGLRVEDVHDAHGLDLLGREQPKLYLLNGAQRALGDDGGAGRHSGGCLGGLRKFAGCERKERGGLARPC